jgi:hypothetical protein
MGRVPGARPVSAPEGFDLLDDQDPAACALVHAPASGHTGGDQLSCSRARVACGVGAGERVENSGVVFEESELTSVLEAGEGTALVGFPAVTVTEITADLDDLSLQFGEAARTNPAWLAVCEQRGYAEKESQQADANQSHPPNLPGPVCGRQRHCPLATLPGQG